MAAGKVTDVHRGQQSPATKMEPILAQLLVKASQANVARLQTETIVLANELVDGKPIGQRIIDWKMKHVW